MKIIALDIESYFDNEYSLKRMSTEAYIRDPRFILHGASIKWSPEHPAKWYDEPYLRQVLKEENWADIGVICHHAQFDLLILNHHYGVRPGYIFDTLSMARLLLGNYLSVSLDAVRKQYGLPSKRTPYELFKGKHWRELDQETQELIADGCSDEVESIWTLFGKLAKDFPEGEYSLVDMTVRMFTEPALLGDVELLGKLWMEEAQHKWDLCREMGITPEELQSADRFAELLRAEGIEPATKFGKRETTYAFAKTDDFMKDLLDHDDPRISGLARARLGIKSTTIQTRAETLGYMAGRGPLCVYLRFAGAVTTRWSGGDGSNFQNFKRANRLRKTLVSPPGFQLAVIDAAQIECRVLNYLAGQQDVVERFQAGEDPYVGIASKFYGRAITRADEAERGTGKQAELSCGYGSGAARFRRTAQLGLYGPPVNLTEEQAQDFVGLYRDTHHEVVCYWWDAERALIDMAKKRGHQWGPLKISNQRITLPTGVALIYDTIEADPDTDGWRYKTRQGWTRIWGSKLVQHVCEAVARAIVAEAMQRIAAQGLRIVGMSHDEVWVLIPDNGHKQENYEFCVWAMKQTPEWLSGLPLDAEGTLGERYTK